MNIQGLIERYEKFKASKKKLTSVDLVLKDLRSLDEPEPLPFKLKDVVGRIRGFDTITQAIWLNTILKELGNDYGLMKYRSGYDQGLLDGAWVGNQLKDADKIRQELNKPVVPQSVVDWIEYFKKCSGTLYGSAAPYSYYGRAITDDFEGDVTEVLRWIRDNSEVYARAWLDGYEVKKEKRYKVVMSNIASTGGVLTRIKHDESWIWIDTLGTIVEGRTHARKELEDAGFGWVFDCPGIKIEEVEE